MIRRQTPVARDHFLNWFDAVRENPRLIWETPAIRYTTYGLCLILLGWSLSAFATWVSPPLPTGAKNVAVTADFHVLCTNPNCELHFVINRPFGFHKFPVECPKCHQPTGHSARRCFSENCKGQWIAPIEENGKLTCPHCGSNFN
ncbi:MAG: hypothetical protein AABZ47_02460 [Planctomycetota bacterium]